MVWSYRIQILENKVKDLPMVFLAALGKKEYLKDHHFSIQVHLTLEYTVKDLPVVFLALFGKKKESPFEHPNLSDVHSPQTLHFDDPECQRKSCIC